LRPSLKRNKPPKSEAELLQYCQVIEGLSLAQLAAQCDLHIPENPVQRKGWTGVAVEIALGATAGSQSKPDFEHLGIELKTLPINHTGKPAESTFITTIPLLTIHQQIWRTSQCYAKLKRVLWLPVEGDIQIPFSHRRIGRAVLWSPSCQEETILENDWFELTTMISTGRLEEINASMGEYLQVRPKAANAKSLCYGFDEAGNKILTLPRGFYLRSRFTALVL
jgi:DNA mismatch repair protein MutH